MSRCLKRPDAKCLKKPASLPRDRFHRLAVDQPLRDFRRVALPLRTRHHAQHEHVFSLCLPEQAAVTIAPDEHLGYRWLPWREAAAACFSWSNRDASSSCRNGLPCRTSALEILPRRLCNGEGSP